MNKKKREERTKGITLAIRKKVKSIMDSFRQIEENERIVTRKKKKKPRYEELIIKIIDSVENKKSLDREAFNELIKMHPHLEIIVLEMISQVKLFSIYDLEPMVVNFNYSRWLDKIKIKLEA